MNNHLTRKDLIAAMVMQAIIIKHQVLRPTPHQAAKEAMEHTDALLEYMGNKRRATKPSPKGLDNPIGFAPTRKKSNGKLIIL